MPLLVIEKGKEKGKRVRVRENAPATLGRDAKSTLRIADVMASRKHCQIQGRLGRWTLRDLDSSNGTLLNGQPVEGEVSLAFDDKVQVGQTLVFFLEDEQHDKRGPLSGRDIAGYRVGEILGRGGMGSVYGAVQVSLERNVALKVLAPELVRDKAFIERFISEARRAGQLNHPNIVQVYDVGNVDDVYFYSMEYVSQGSVTDLLRKDRMLTVERSLALVLDAARGLEYAERKGVVHRDIKPDNLMISEDWVVKIGDLGIAQKTTPDGSANQEEGISGSPYYIAPEQAMGRPIDTRADIYALGVTFFEMLSGEPPFTGNTMREIVLKHVREDVPDIRKLNADVAPEVAAVITRMTQRDPEQRYLRAEQLVSELAALANVYPLRESQRVRAPIDLRSAATVAIAPGEMPGSSSTDRVSVAGPASVATPGSREGPGAPASTHDDEPLDEDDPDAPPSSFTGDAAAPAEDSGYRPVILGCLVILVLAVAAISSIGAYRLAKNHRKQQIEQAEAWDGRLQAITTLIDGGEYDEAITTADAFAADETVDEAWRAKAREYAEEARTKRSDATAAQRDAAATTRLEQITGAVDASDLASLVKGVADLEALVDELGGTDAAAKAATRIGEWRQAIAGLRAAETEMKERLELEEQRFARVRRQVLDDLSIDDDFAKAFSEASRARVAAPKDLPTVIAGYDALVREIRDEAGKHVDELQWDADRDLKRAKDDNDELRARQVKERLEAFLPKIRGTIMPMRIKRLDDTAKKAGAIAREIVQGQRQEQIDRDLRALEPNAADENKLRAFDFESFVTELDEEKRGFLDTEEGLRSCDRRIRLHQAAARARDRLIAHVTGAAKFEAKLTYVQKSTGTLIAVKASRAGGIHFEHDEMGAEWTIPWEKVDAGRMTEYVKALPELDLVAHYELAATLFARGWFADSQRELDAIRAAIARGDPPGDAELPGWLDELAAELALKER